MEYFNFSKGGSALERCCVLKGFSPSHALMQSCIQTAFLQYFRIILTWNADFCGCAGPITLFSGSCMQFRVACDNQWTIMVDIFFWLTSKLQLPCNCYLNFRIFNQQIYIFLHFQPNFTFEHDFYQFKLPFLTVSFNIAHYQCIPTTFNKIWFGEQWLYIMTDPCSGPVLPFPIGGRFAQVWLHLNLIWKIST